MAVIVDTGVNNAGLRAGLSQAESMLSASVRRMGTRLGAVGAGIGGGVNLAVGRMAQLGQATNRMERMIGVSGRLNQSLDRMSGLFNSALGIGATVGGLALLERAFTRSVEKAREFQTAQIAIAATLQSAYKITDTKGREASGPEAFKFATQQAQRFNMEIIQRQARNILVYQEQLGAFQSSLAAGARKGLAPRQILDLSESAAVVAKTLGLRGEQIANAARLLMGGGVNVGRSTIGRALGVSNVDITSRSGEELMGFLKGKMKGFMSPEVQKSFGESIEGVMSTLESKFDIFWAKIGKGFMSKITPALEELGAALGGTGAGKFAESLSNLFLSLFKALEAIVRSPAIPVIMKFVDFLANFGDKIIIGAVLLKLVGILDAAGSKVLGFAATLDKLATSALASAQAVGASAAAIEGNAAAAATGTAAAGGMAAAREGAKVAAGAAGIAGVSTAELSVLTAAQRGAIVGLMAKGTPQALAQARNLAKGMISRRVSVGSIGAGAVAAATLAEEEAVALAATPLLQRRGLASLRPLGSRAGLKAVGGEFAGIGSKLMGKAMPALMIGGGIELGSGMLGGKDTPLGAGITHMAAGIVTGAMMGSTFGPIGTATGAIVGALTATGKILTDASNRLKETLDKAITDLEETRTKHPIAAKITDLQAEEARIRSQMRGNKPGPIEGGYKPVGGAAGRFMGSLMYGLGVAPELPAIGNEGATAELTNKTLQGALKRNQEAQAKLKKEGEYQFLANTKIGDAAKALADAQAAVKLGEMGYGRGAMFNRPELEAQLKLAELKQMRLTGAVKPIDADLVQRQKDAEAGVAQLAEISRKRGKRQPTPEERTAEDAERKRLEKEGADLEEIQYKRLQKGIRARAADTTAAMQLELKQQKSELDVRPITGEYLRGKLGVEKQMLGQKEVLGAEYEGRLKQALKNFENLFNKPLKKIENAIQNLSLGIDSENVEQAAILAFRAVREKIRQAVHVFHSMTKTEGERLLGQREQQMQAALLKEGYAGPRRLGQVATAQSEIAQSEAGALGTMAGAYRNPMTAGAYGTIGGLEGMRRSGQFTPEQFQKLQGETIRQGKQDIFRNWQLKNLETQEFRLQEQARPIQEDISRMGLPQAQMGVEQAAYQSKVYEAGLNPRNARMMERAQRMVGRDERRIGMGEAEGLVREGIALQRQNLEAAEKKAQLDLQLAEIADRGISVLSQQNDLIAAIKWDELGKVVEDATSGIQAFTDYTHGKVGDVDTSGENTAKSAEGGSPINISIEPKASITMKDIDPIMGDIRTALCRLAAQSGGRG
jgi:hypothetical protein